MFSKNADSAAPRAGAPPPRTGWSITRKLMAFFTLSAFGMLAVVTGVQFWILMQEVAEDEVYMLADKIRVLGITLRYHGDDLVMLDHEVRLEEDSAPGSRHHHYMYHTRVLDEAGRVIIETPQMGALLPASIFPAPVDLEAAFRQKSAERVKALNGRSYLLRSAWARSGGTDGPKRVIQAAMDDAGERAVVVSFRRDSLLALAVGTILFAGIGVAIARRSMRPVHNLARFAEGITAGRLSERIEPDPTRWPAELASLAAALSGMLSRLEEAYNRCAQSAEDLAHELRTPIQNLMGEAEVALSKERTEEEYRRVLESALEEYARLSRMINELLFLARAENPHTIVERTRFDVRPEMESVVEFHRAQFEEDDRRFVCEGDGQLEADLQLFRRALSNLVANAVQHTPRGGQIKLAVRQPDIRLVEVSVTDTGRGIPAKHLSRLGDRFYRPDRTISPGNQGAGLGLAIVKSIMALHGGSVVIESTEGCGTTVVLRFPLPTAGAIEPGSPMPQHRDEPGAGPDSDSLRARPT